MWMQFAFGMPVMLWAGWPLLARGWTSVRNRSLNMFSLIALGGFLLYYPGRNVSTALETLSDFLAGP